MYWNKIKNRLVRILTSPVFPDLLFIFILSLTPLLWFREGHIMVGHDNVFPLDPITFLKGRLSTWIDYGLGQSQALIMGSIPTHVIDALPYFLGFDLQTTQKIVYIFWFLMIGFSAYILAYALNRSSRVFKLTAVILYQFNFFILQAWWIGERTKFSAYIAMPLVLTVFLTVYKGKLKIFPAAVLNSLILFIFNAGGLFGTPLFGGFFIALGIFLLFFTILEIYNRRYFLIKKICLLFFLTLIGFILSNAYFILPMASKISSQYGNRLSGIGGVSGVIGWAEEISANTSFTNLLRLQGIAEWYDNPEHLYAKFYLNNPLLVFLSFLWPVLAVVSLFLIKEKKKLRYLLYFFLVYLVGIFFAAGTHPPLGFIYKFLLKFIPGFVIFRTPYFKFAPAIFISYAFITAFTIDFFRGYIRKLAFVLFSIFVFAYHFPFFTGSFFAWREGFSTRLKIPDYVLEFGKWINKNVNNERILLLPPNNSNWQFDIYNWGYMSFQTLPTLTTKKAILVNNDKLNDSETKAINALYNLLEKGDIHKFNLLANILNIRYLLVRNDFAYQLDWIPTVDPDKYKQILQEKIYANRIRQFGQWDLYELANLPTKKVKLLKHIDYVDINNELLNFYYVEGIPDYFISRRDFNSGLEDSLQEQISNLVSRSYLSPKCINCRHEKSFDLNLPDDISILPSSPFYPLIIKYENFRYGDKDPKTNIYDYIGLSLKRINELRQSVYKTRKLNNTVIENYKKLMISIEDEFSELESYEDKYQIAEDINLYLEGEEKLIIGLVGDHLSDTQQIEKVTQILSYIQNIQNIVAPHRLGFERNNNRLYQFLLAKPGKYEILVRAEDLQQVLTEKDEIKLDINNKKVENQIAVSDLAVRDNWLSLGKYQFQANENIVLLSYPQSPDFAGEFRSEKIGEIDRRNNCIVTGIKDFNPKRVYKLELEYDPIVFDGSFIFVNKVSKIGKNKVAEKTITQLETLFFRENYDSLIFSTLDTQKVEVGVCSPTIEKEMLEKLLSIKEVIQPRVLVKSTNLRPAGINSVSLHRISPTKYNISFENRNKAGILVFMERFDRGWKLSEFENNHIQINGFANGWVIDKQGFFNLTLEYKPQRVFYIGGGISIAYISGSLIYLLIEKRKNQYDK